MHSILVVDDVPTNISVTVDTLKHDYKVLIAIRGQHALDIAVSDHAPDLILLDLNMPRKNGYECIEEIRADCNLAHVPIVVLTTSISDLEVMRAYGLGANSFVTKPTSFAKTVSTLRGLMDYWDGLVRLPDCGYRRQTDTGT